MKCKKIRKLLSLYLDEQLPLEKTAQVQSHLKECGACSAELEVFKQVHLLMAAAPKHPAPAGLTRAVMNRIAAPETTRSIRIYRVWSRLATAMVVILVVFFGFFAGRFIADELVPNLDTLRDSGIALDIINSESQDEFANTYLAIMEVDHAKK